VVIREIIKDGSKLPVITEPGIYSGIDNSRYHGQCTDTPSISSSMLKTLADECPAVLRHNSYLNSERVYEPKSHFEFGTALHLMYLEPHLLADAIEVLDFPDWRTKKAQEARDAARAEGKTPLLPDDVAKLHAMRSALLDDPIARTAFTGGHSELSHFIKDRETGVWLKCRTDYLRELKESAAVISDYKSSTTANPDDFCRKAWGYRYFQSAAFYIDIVRQTTGLDVSDFWMVTQSKSAPYLVTVNRFDADALEAGRELNRKAIRQFAQCLARDEWPGYRHADTPDLPTAFTLSLPRYAEHEIAQILGAAA